jgi:hypothetical protein
MKLDWTQSAFQRGLAEKATTLNERPEHFPKVLRQKRLSMTVHNWQYYSGQHILQISMKVAGFTILVRN